MRIVQQENATVQVGNNLFNLRAVEATARGAFQTIEQAGLVPLGLQAANEPGAHIGEGFVIQVNRVLSGKDHANAKSARLLEQG